MESKYTLIRNQLNKLGYRQLLVPDSTPLVEKLLADLVQTTASLEKYKKIAKEALEVRFYIRLFYYLSNKAQR